MNDDHIYDGSNYADAECYMNDAHSIDFDNEPSRALLFMAFAQTKATLAIADALNNRPETASEQREGVEPDPLDESDHRDRIDCDGERWTRNPRGCWHLPDVICHYSHDDAPCNPLASINEGYGPLTFAPAPDPLDEDDHRDRMLAIPEHIVRVGHKHWHTPGFANCRPGEHGEHGYSLEAWNTSDGPLTFAPEPSPDGAGDDPSAPQPEPGHKDGDDAPEALLCPECGHGIKDHERIACHCVNCRCREGFTGVARTLIDQTRADERKRLAGELRMLARRWEREAQSWGHGEQIQRGIYRLAAHDMAYLANIWEAS